MVIENKIGKYRPNGTWYQRAVNTIKVITVHHTASRTTGTNEAKLTALMNTHVGQDWPGLAYHFVITQDGKIYQINNFADVTWHDSINWDSIGVALVGYFYDPHNEEPTQAQLASLKALLDDLSTNHPEFPAGAANVYGHKERSSTACPGTLLPKVIEYRTKLGDVSWGGAVPVPVPTPTPTPVPVPPVGYVPVAELNEMRISRDNWKKRAADARTKLAELRTSIGTSIDSIIKTLTEN